MTPAQLLILKDAILAETDPAFVGYRTNGQNTLMAEFYKRPSTFIVWRTNVPASDTGNAWIGTDIDGMSALNMQRLQLLLASAPGGFFDMSRSDRRAGFENPFGTNANNASRVAMRAAWKRPANKGEALYTTGAGTDAVPGLLTFEGQITDTNIQNALAS